MLHPAKQRRSKDLQLKGRVDERIRRDGRNLEVVGSSDKDTNKLQLHEIKAAVEDDDDEEGRRFVALQAEGWISIGFMVPSTFRCFVVRKQHVSLLL